MTLLPGTRLGTYEVIGPLGAGGMGEVYRARDTKLDRDVAIKVLPERLAADSAALARFEREAKTVAALSHPNLLGIYDFGQQDGVTYAVTELLSGETLRDKLAAGPIPRRKAIEYALQIARGLGAAHEHGVAHRDLKPENVFVTNDGRVKILDFGLAKPLLPESGVSGAATFGATEPGTVLGTVGYMSPEQVRGRPADHRSDIFSFGAILYEMLSGQRAFKGDSAVETMNAILIRDLPEPSGPPEDLLPPLLDRIVRHCLEKNPEERFQSARDVAFDLETVSGTTSSATRQLIAPVREKPRWLAPAAGLAIALLLAGAFQVGKRAAAGGKATDVPAITFSQQTNQQGVEKFPALSPDGNNLAYVSRETGNDDIYLQRVGGHNPINLTKDSSEDDTQPAFSPDGSAIAFRSGRGGGGIFVMGATGESVRRLSDAGYNPSWSPDGKQIVVATEAVDQPLARSGLSELWTIDVATGEKRKLFEGDAVQPSWSPHGDRIAFWAIPKQTAQRDIWTIAATGGAPVAVTQDAALDWNPIWSADGKSLYFASDRGGSMNLWRVAIDEKTGKATGALQALTTPSLSTAHLSISRDGKRIAYLALNQLASLEKVPFDPRSGKAAAPAPLLRQSGVLDSPDVSPDGEWVVFYTVGGQEDLFLVRSDGTGLRKLTDDLHRDRGPSWSPDGKRIAFYSNRDAGKYEICVINPDGSGLTQLTRMTDGGLSPWWSPDGKRIAYPTGSGSNVFDVAAGPARAPEPLPLFAEPGRWFQVTSWSPDGRSLAGGGVPHAASGGGGVVLYSFESRRYERLVERGEKPIWLRDGRQLLFLSDPEHVSLLDARTKQARPVYTAPRGSEIADYTLSKDDRWICVIRSNDEGDVWLAKLERN
ncbi:MAG TPA: protein kinase [Thermoanaerobaculia bacterium]|nr:protein kinase [Thermoanaerobaculia bacterium]